MYGYKYNNLLMFLSVGTFNHCVYSSRMMGTRTNTTHSQKVFFFKHSDLIFVTYIDSMHLAINRTQDLSTNLSFGTLDVQ